MNTAGKEMNMTRVDLEAVLLRIEAGDDSAWEELLSSLRVRMMNLLVRRGAPHDQAEDLVQEALASVWRSWRNVRSPDRFWSWVASITLNQLRSARSRARMTEVLPVETPSAARDPLEAIMCEETRQWVQRRIETFKHAEMRDAVRLRVLESLEPAEAAQRMGVTRGRLRRWLHLGVVRLRQTSLTETGNWGHAVGAAG